MQEDADRWKADCHDLGKQIASLRDVIVARCAVNRVHEPGALMSAAEFRRCELNATNAIATLSQRGDSVHEAGAMTQTVTLATYALSAVLEFEHQQNLQLARHGDEVEKNIKGLQGALHKAQAVIHEHTLCTGYRSSHAA